MKSGEARERRHDMTPWAGMAGNRIRRQNWPGKICPKPGGGDATDQTLWNDQMILAHEESWSGDRHDGLYRFDPQSGQLRPILSIPDASAAWVPRETSP